MAKAAVKSSAKGSGGKKAPAKGKHGSKKQAGKKGADNKGKTNAQYSTKPGNAKETYSANSKDGKNPKQTNTNQESKLEKTVKNGESHAEKTGEEVGTAEVYSKIYARKKRTKIGKKEGRKSKYRTVKGENGVIYADFRTEEQRAEGKGIEELVDHSDMEHMSEKKIDEAYTKLEKEIGPLRENAPEVTASESRKYAPHNMKNIIKSGFDNTIGYLVALAQNHKTIKELKNDPGTKSKIVYLMHGVMQNEGSMWRLAKSLREAGFLPYHLHASHSQSRDDVTKDATQQIRELQKETGLKDAKDRGDIFSGHSSGADVGIYLSGKRNIKDLGIGFVQARAPAPYGIKTPKTFGQKILMPFVSHDNASKKEGKVEALKMAARKPVDGVQIDIIAGKYDKLATPQTAPYKHATHHYIIDHPDSTHFGTSGVNKKINSEYLIPHLKFMVNHSKSQPKVHHIDIHKNYEMSEKAA